jgi:xeroderma pigmentosum group C-complementing protein
MAGGGGGGFLLGADDVVQAFHLPKYQHVNLSEPLITATTVSGNEIVATTEDPGQEPLKNFTYDLQTMDVDSDIDMEEIATIPIAGQAAPKTMQEMAEDAARLRINDDNDSNGDEAIDTEGYRPSPFIQTPDGRETPSLKITLPSRAKAQKPSTPQANASTKQPPHARSSKPASEKKRRRDDEEDEMSHEAQSSPKRRTRSKPDLPTPSMPARTLRPRASKTSTQLDEEREQEEAYRRAIAR